MKCFFRLEIQAKVQHLGRNPGIAAQQAVESAREQLTALVQELKSATQATGVVELHTSKRPVQEALAMWDEIVNEPVLGGQGENTLNPIEEPALTGPIQIEDQIMPLPSNGNVGPEYGQLEITHRIKHADQHLNRIRDLIAEKSFQYSHVIRVAPRKAVNTRSRAQVKKINLEISVHCRLYTQCRARLIKLGAPPEITNRFEELTTEDVKASTVIVNPNETGSTQLKLSWIWQTSGGHRWGLATRDNRTAAGAGADPNVIECKQVFVLVITILIINTVRRVHWLRARAQLMRWQEEVTLTGYEMQWTVRYFRYMSLKWVLPSELSTASTSSRTGTVTGTPFLSAGAITYWNRKRTCWEGLMTKADRIFADCHPAYHSPL